VVETTALIVCFPFHEAARVPTENEFATLVVDEDGDAEGESSQPPSEPERVHTQPLVEARAVAQEGGQRRLEEDAERQVVVLHALLEEGEATGLADDDVGPLHDDDGDEEGCVARVLKLLALGVRPFLAVGILEVVDPARVPLHTDAQQAVVPEPVLAHDDKVREEARRRLDHTNLTVRHGDQSLVDKLVLGGVARLALHDVVLGLLVGEGDGGNHVGAQIDAQDGDGAEGQRDVA